MNLDHATEAFAALAQATRLQVFKILVEYGPKGVSAGVMGARLGIAHNTLSFHLSHLAQVGLVTRRKLGRSMIYAPNCDGIEDLIGYLKENCCIEEVEGGAECSNTSKVMCP